MKVQRSDEGNSECLVDDFFFSELAILYGPHLPKILQVATRLRKAGGLIFI